MNTNITTFSGKLAYGKNDDGGTEKKQGKPSRERKQQRDNKRQF